MTPYDLQRMLALHGHYRAVEADSGCDDYDTEEFFADLGFSRREHVVGVERLMAGHIVVMDAHLA